MKKIALVAVFSLLSFGLMAAEEVVNTNNDSTNISNQISRNSIIIGFGGASNSMKVQDNDGDWGRISDFDAKTNFNLAYLRKLSAFNNKLSIGADFTMFMNKGMDEESVETDSYGVWKDYSKASYDTYTLMLLTDYELARFSKFDISAQLGLGFAFNLLDSSYGYSYISGTHSSSYSASGKGSSAVAAAKIGLVANYNFAKHFAVGAGFHYLYMGESKITIYDEDNNLKNNGTMTYNVNLKWMF
ncbi:MAG: hypothetical protein LBH40_02720 [Alphaproteobacteria bacterium]|jgi:hypothetical protein|nr:hypothetical protein [Alphaproteobacteria bacterium]